MYISAYAMRPSLYVCMCEYVHTSNNMAAKDNTTELLSAVNKRGKV